MMKHPDFATSSVKKRLSLISSIRSSLDDRDESMCPSSAFDLDSYNSRDEWLGLNRL